MDEGYELQFGTNFIGHYALTGHLYPILMKTPGSRVVSLSRRQLMEPWQSALPYLYAATSTDVIKGGFYQPDQDGGYRGYLVEEAIEPIALDSTVNQKLWQLAEETTGCFINI